MKNKALIFIFLFLGFSLFRIETQENYQNHHQEIIDCKKLIIKGKYKETIFKFDSLFKQFDFVFFKGY